MLSCEMEFGRGRRIPRFPSELARAEECSESHTNCCSSVDTVEIEWNKGEDFEENVLGEREPETTFSFPIMAPGAFDDEIDARVTECMGGHAVASVVGAEGRHVTFESDWSDRWGNGGKPVGNGYDGGWECR